MKNIIKCLSLTLNKPKVFFLFLSYLIGLSCTISHIHAFSENTLKYQNLGEAIIHTYSNDNFYGHGTNWSIQQHSNGVIFVSNDGFHSFDGANWRTHHLQDNSSIRQFVIHPNGRIYFGSDSAFGYFEAADNGQLIFNSLLAELDENNKSFSDIYNVYLQGEKIVFISPEQIMIYSLDVGFKIIKPEQSFSRSWQVGDKIFFADGKKFKYLTGLAIYNVEGIEQYKIKRFGFVEALGDGYLIGTYAKGIYLWKNGELIPWLNKLRPESGLGFTNSLRINQELFAVSSIHGGVLFFNADAEVVYRLNRDSGLPTNITLGLFLDNQQGLWVGQEGSLSRAQLPFELSVLANTRFDIANVHDFVRIEDELYLSTINGLQIFESNGVLRIHPDTIASVSKILKHNNRVIIGGSQQCQILNPETGEVTTLLLTVRCRELYISQKHQNTLFIVTNNSVMTSRWDGQQWQVPITIIEDIIIDSLFVEDARGGIWNSTDGGNLIRISHQSLVSKIPGNDTDIFTDTSSSNQEKWLVEQVKVDNSRISPLVLDGKLLIATDEGLFNWSYKNQKLANKVEWYHDHFSKNASGPYLIYKDKDQRLWLANDKQSGYFSHYSNSKVTDWVSYPIAVSGMSGLSKVYEEGENIWLGFDTGVVRYKPSLTDNQNIAKAGVSQVTLKNQNKTLALNVLTHVDQALSYKNVQGSLRVYFGLSNYLQGQNNQYRYRLNDDNWSIWSKENYVDLGELSGGSYQLDMQALDPLANTSTAEPLLFLVRPAWYASFWAYNFYLAILIGLLYLVSILLSKARVKRLLERQHLLEQQVLERTETIQKQSNELKRVNQAKTRFFANISHEFRTPLTLAIGPLQTLLRKSERYAANDKRDPQDKQYLKIALENSQQMLALVGQILDVNRLDSEEMPIAVVEIKLGLLLQKILKRFQFLADKQDIALVSFGLDRDDKIWFDEDHLFKIVSNLLSNALKFSPKGSLVQLVLHFQHERNRVQIEVKDEGQGIPEAEREHIFERYFQGENSSNNIQPGTGIGLSIVNELLQLHQASIELDKEHKRGCLFRITIKMGKDHYLSHHFIELTSINNLTQVLAVQDSTSSVLPEELSSRLTNETLATVLVVDDNSDLRLFIKNSLQSSYNIIEASQGEEALQLVESQQPDFIICDVMMPVMDGMELTKRLKSNPGTAHIPLLLLTAKATKRNTVEGLQQGADDYLSKPFDSAELAARIGSHLQQKKNISQAIYESFKRETDNSCSLLQLSSKKEKLSPKSAFEQKFSKLILDNLSDPDFDILAMSDAMNMDRSTLFRHVKADFECSPKQYLKEQRLQLSVQMLEKQSGSISEIAYAVGFQSLNYFSRSFREQFAVSPSNYHVI